MASHSREYCSFRSPQYQIKNSVISTHSTHLVYHQTVYWDSSVPRFQSVTSAGALGVESFDRNQAAARGGGTLSPVSGGVNGVIV